jgi:LysM repeat protein
MGRLPQPGSGKPGFNIAIITIVALHVVFFGGLLLQGCGRKVKDEEPPLQARVPATNTLPDTLTGLGQPYPETTNLAALAARPEPLNFTSPPPAEPIHQPAPTNLFMPLPPSQGSTGGLADRTVVGEPTPAPAPRTTTEYKVAKGDSLWSIAQKHGITTEQLRDANPEAKPQALQIGTPLMIPQSTRKEGAAAGMTAGTTAPGGTVYRVKAGDTLTKIAKAHGTTPAALRTVNKLKTDRIVVNQELRIPSGASNQAGTVKQP